MLRIPGPRAPVIIVLSTESGETEFWKYPANGIGAPEQWTYDAKVLRWEGVPSPDGRWEPAASAKNPGLPSSRLCAAAGKSWEEWVAREAAKKIKQRKA